MIKRCVKKDKEAWDEFVTRYSRLIYNYIYAIFKAKGYKLSEDKASDIYQGIFLSLVRHNCRKLRSFRGRNNCSFTSWLRIITINFTLDYLRRMHQADISLDEDMDSNRGMQLKDILTDKEAGSDTLVLDKEKVEQLSECIKTLNTQEKYFVQMHIYQGLAMEEVAHLLKVERGTADMRKNRIIEKLKECFRRKNFM